MSIEPRQSISFCSFRILGTNTVLKASRKKEREGGKKERKRREGRKDGRKDGRKGGKDTVKGSRIRIALDFSVAALETEENGAMLSEFSGEMT